MAPQETKFNRRTLDDVAQALAGDGGVSSEVFAISRRPIPLPNIGAHNYGNSGGGVPFAAADDLMTAIRTAHHAMLTSTAQYSQSINLMGGTLSAIGVTYDDAAKKENTSVNNITLSADQLQQAINAASKPTGTQSV